MGYRMKLRAASKSAEILLYDDVGANLWGDGVTAKQFTADLRALGKVNRIDIRINSYGGDVFEGLTIYRQLVDNAAEVHVHIDGVAASIASIIAMAGQQITIAESGFIMIHNAWGGVMGDAASMREYADRLDAVSGQLTSIYVSRTGQKKEVVEEWMAGETWMDAALSLDRGFATDMAPNQQMAARAVYNPVRHGYKHVPRGLVFAVKETARSDVKQRQQALFRRAVRQTIGEHRT